jgi:ribonuclease E
MPRRKQRQLSQKVRFQTEQSEVIAPVVEPVVETAQNTQLAKLDLPAVVEATPEHDDNGEARDNNGMPRRSRRSPRHLRVSGQRRRRYRDERYPTQSPMPLTVACASPELASGKVFIRYPIARPQEQQFEEQNVAPEAIEPIVASPVEVAEAAAVVVEETQQVVAEPQPVVESAPVIEPQPVVETAEIETTHPEVIAAPVDEQPQFIAQEDTVVAEQVAEEAQPAEAVVEEEVVTEAVVEQPVEVTPEPQAPTPAPVVKPEPVVAAVVEHHYATAPMTRAPAPEYVPEAPRHSDWVRPAFDFDGRGSAGGHSATHQATAPATRPQPAE